MTCIVGLVEGDTVWMGGDSAGVAGDYRLTVRADQKVFRKGPMLFGFTTSFRMGQILRYSLAIPEHDSEISIEQFMATAFVDAVRSCLRESGWASKTNERENGGTFLVAFKGRLFTVFDDYQVAIAADGYDAIGCGDLIARGALFASDGRSGRDRVEIALMAAERMSAGVRGPFVVEALLSEAPALAQVGEVVAV